MPGGGDFKASPRKRRAFDVFVQRLINRVTAATLAAASSVSTAVFVDPDQQQFDIRW